tara:strand:- start:1632 stop:2510 length:879 start_codon:yes stop_codon:yes gene_type:complete
MTDERLNIWLSFAKYAVIAGGVAIATTVINSDLQDKEIKLREVETKAQIALKNLEKKAEINSKVIEQEKQYLKDFLANALDENTERKYQFALFFKSLTYSQEFAKGWDEYFSAVAKQRVGIKDERDREIAELKNKSGLERKAAEEKIAKLESELSRSSAQIKKLNISSIPVKNIINMRECSTGDIMKVSAFRNISLNYTFGKIIKAFSTYFDKVNSLKLNSTADDIDIFSYCVAKTGRIYNLYTFDRSGVGHQVPDKFVEDWIDANTDLGRRDQESEIGDSGAGDTNRRDKN